MTEWARAFRLQHPDGSWRDGAQFPSGRCVLDDRMTGLVGATDSIEALAATAVTIEWEDGIDD